MYYFDYSYFVTIIDFLQTRLFPILVILFFVSSLSFVINIVRWFIHK